MDLSVQVPMESQVPQILPIEGRAEEDVEAPVDEDVSEEEEEGEQEELSVAPPRGIQPPPPRPPPPQPPKEEKPAKGSLKTIYEMLVHIN